MKPLTAIEAYKCAKCGYEVYGADWDVLKKLMIEHKAKCELAQPSPEAARAVIPAEDGADYFVSPRSAAPIAAAAQDERDLRAIKLALAGGDVKAALVMVDAALTRADSYRKESEAKNEGTDYTGYCDIG